MDKLGLKEGEMIQHPMITKSIERAQKKVEENNFGIRKRLLEYDDVMNSQREVIYKKRRHALLGERLSVDIANMMYDVTENLVGTYHEDTDFDGFELELLRSFSMESPVIAAGGSGVISVLANAYPSQTSEIVNNALKGNFKTSREMHFRFMEMIELLFADGNPSGVKAMLNQMNICQNTLRLPLVTVNKITLEKILKAMKEVR